MRKVFSIPDGMWSPLKHALNYSGYWWAFCRHVSEEAAPGLQPHHAHRLKSPISTLVRSSHQFSFPYLVESHYKVLTALKYYSCDTWKHVQIMAYLSCALAQHYLCFFSTRYPAIHDLIKPHQFKSTSKNKIGIFVF